jgi:hypothetical protein
MTLSSLLYADLPTLADDSTAVSTRWVWEHRWPLGTTTSLLVIAALVGMLVLLYRRQAEHLRPRQRWTLLGLRGFSLAALLVMLTQVVLVQQRVGLPALWVVLDDSASMSTDDAQVPKKDGSATKKEPAARSSTSRYELAKSLLLAHDAQRWKDWEERYRVEVFLLSETLRPLNATAAADVTSPAKAREQTASLLRAGQPTGKESLLGTGLLELLEARRGTPPAAIVLLSDGITTRGPLPSDAAEVAKQQGVPLYCIGLGEERIVRDLELAEVLAPANAWVDDLVVVEAFVAASGYEGKTYEVQLAVEGESEPVDRQTLTAGKPGENQRVTLAWRPTRGGNYSLTVRIVPLEDEASKDNNQRTLALHVREQRLKILLAAGEPNYDYRFLKDLLQREASVELRVLLQDADVEFRETNARGETISLPLFPLTAEELKTYAAVILCDIDPRRCGQAAGKNLSDYVHAGGGLVMLPGQRHWPTVIRASDFAELLPVGLEQATWSPALTEAKFAWRSEPSLLGQTKAALQLGDKPGDNERWWRERLDPLYQRLDGVRLKPTAQVLVNSVGGQPTTTEPLVITRYAGVGQVVFHASDETWRWRARHGGPAYVRYWMQTLRQLGRAGLDATESTARLFTDRRQYRAGEPVRLLAQIPAGKSAEGATAIAQIESNTGVSRRYTLTLDPRQPTFFSGPPLALASGEYKARLVEPAGIGAVEARWNVLAAPGELERTGLDAAELQRAATISRGGFARYADADKLWPRLPPGRPLELESLPPRPYWNRWPLLAFALGCLVAEWGLRKWWGMT